MRFFTIKSFRKDLKQLKKKKYTSHSADICSEFEGKTEEEIRNMSVNLSGTSNENENLLIKRRINNSQHKTGKAGGFRLIFLITKLTNVILLNLYSKKEQENHSVTEIEQRLLEYEQENENQQLEEVDIENRLNKKQE